MVKKSIDRRELDKIVVILNMSNSEDVNIVNFVEITTYITMLNSVKHRKTTRTCNYMWSAKLNTLTCMIDDNFDARYHIMNIKLIKCEIIQQGMCIAKLGIFHLLAMFRYCEH